LPSARVSQRLQQRVRTAVENATAEIAQLSSPHNIQVRQVEGKLFITLEAIVDGHSSVADAHDLSTRLQEGIRASLPNVGDVLIHLEPEGEPVE
jgi:divalent metal cation (Fe/Co/Zn/Cd) transporter